MRVNVNVSKAHRQQPCILHFYNIGIQLVQLFELANLRKIPQTSSPVSEKVFRLGNYQLQSSRCSKDDLHGISIDFPTF